MTEGINEFVAQQLVHLSEQNGKILQAVEDSQHIHDEHARAIQGLQETRATHEEVERIVGPITGKLDAIDGKVDKLDTDMQDVRGRLDRVEHPRSWWRTTLTWLTSRARSWWASALAITATMVGTAIGTWILAHLH
jgi:hypothetical protein